VDRFLGEEAGNSRFFSPSSRAGHALFDLAGFITDRLRRAGIIRVEDIGHCTYADPARFFSYRRATHRAEPDYGRHVNGIALAD
jgi:polyphenol oxidase